MKLNLFFLVSILIFSTNISPVINSLVDSSWRFTEYWDTETSCHASRKEEGENYIFYARLKTAPLDNPEEVFENLEKAYLAQMEKQCVQEL